MKIRVLHVIPSLATGGAERLVVNLLKALDKNKFEVAACSLYSETGTPFVQELKQHGIPVYCLGKHKGLDLRMMPRLYRLFRTFKPDIVHTHLSVLRYVLLPAALCRIPARFHTVHNIAQKELDDVGKVVHHLAFHMRKVVPISISQEVARTMRILYNAQTPIIYNGIPVEQFQGPEGTRSFRRNKEGLKKSDVVFLHVGRFSLQKNHRLLIEAFEQAIKKSSDLKLLLVGDNELRSDIEKLVKEKYLDQSIRFLGLRQDIPELLTACDIFVLSSDWEGLPMTILEAMAAGRPVIATAVGGVPELVKNGATGLLVPAQNARALSQAMVRLANSPSLRKTMGEQGQKRVLERFDINLIAKQYERLYLETLEAVSQ